MGTERLGDSGVFTWRQLAEVVGILGVILYAVGWFFCALYYAEFDVTPEQVGVDFSYLTVRVGLILATTVVAVAIALQAFGKRWGRITSSAELKIKNGAFLLAFGALQIGVVAALVLIANAWRPWSPLSTVGEVLVIILAAVVGLALLLGEIGLVLVAVNFKSESESVKVPPTLASVLFLAILAVVVVSSAAVAAPRLASIAVNGEEFSLFGFRSEAVTVEKNAVRRTSPPVFDDCVIYLGTDNGVHVLFEPRSSDTFLVSAAAATLRQPVENPCG